MALKLHGLHAEDAEKLEEKPAADENPVAEPAADEKPEEQPVDEKPGSSVI